MLPRLTRRQWNNVIIIACILFITALNLPTIIKTLFISDPYSDFPYVLNPTAAPYKIELPAMSIRYDNGNWSTESFSTLDSTELAQRWRSLVGTEITAEQYQQLSPNLHSPSTVEVWYVDIDEPQRITTYEFEQFWLLQSWENKWLAVSVDGHYLGL